MYFDLMIDFEENIAPIRHCLIYILVQTAIGQPNRLGERKTRGDGGDRRLGFVEKAHF